MKENIRLSTMKSAKKMPEKALNIIPVLSAFRERPIEHIPVTDIVTNAATVKSHFSSSTSHIV